MDKFRPVIPFPNDTKDFVLGFESGIVYTLMELNMPLVKMPLVHTENLQVFQNIGKFFGYEVTVKPATLPEWGALTAYRQIPHSLN